MDRAGALCVANMLFASGSLRGKKLGCATKPSEAHVFDEETTVIFSREYYADDTPLESIWREESPI